MLGERLWFCQEEMDQEWEEEYGDGVGDSKEFARRFLVDRLTTSDAADRTKGAEEDEMEEREEVTET